MLTSMCFAITDCGPSVCQGWGDSSEEGRRGNCSLQPMFLWGKASEDVDESINKSTGHNEQGGEEINREMRERRGKLGQGGQEGSSRR